MMTISEGRAQMPFIVTTKSRRRNEIDEKKRKWKRKDGEEETGKDIYMSATMSSSFMCPRVEHGNLLLLANNES